VGDEGPFEHKEDVQRMQGGQIQSKELYSMQIEPTPQAAPTVQYRQDARCSPSYTEHGETGNRAQAEDF
jgi:hypothetical protein